MVEGFRLVVVGDNAITCLGKCGTSRIVLDPKLETGMYSLIFSRFRQLLCWGGETSDSIAADRRICSLKA